MFLFVRKETIQTLGQLLKQSNSVLNEASQGEESQIASKKK